MKKNQVSSEEQISKLTLEEKKNSKKSNGVFSFLFRLLLSFIICLLGLIALKGGFGLQIHEWTKKRFGSYLWATDSFYKGEKYA